MNNWAMCDWGRCTRIATCIVVVQDGDRIVHRLPRCTEHTHSTMHVLAVHVRRCGNQMRDWLLITLLDFVVVMLSIVVYMFARDLREWLNVRRARVRARARRHTTTTAMTFNEVLRRIRLDEFDDDLPTLLRTRPIVSFKDLRKGDQRR